MESLVTLVRTSPALTVAVVAIVTFTWFKAAGARKEARLQEAARVAATRRTQRDPSDI